MNAVQSVILNIFVEVEKILDDLGLRYFAIGGTAIGAIRHHGFIPWDDDLDIAMPIEDYEVFIKKAKDFLPSHLELRLYNDLEHNENVFCKVVDNRTTFIERIEKNYPDSYKGVWIDIMPMSGVPTGFSGTVFRAKVFLLGAITYGMPWAYSDRDSVKHKVLYVLRLPLKVKFDTRYFLRKWENILIKQPFDKSQYVGYTWWPRLYKLVFPTEWFKSTIDMPFETTTIRRMRLAASRASLSPAD